MYGLKGPCVAIDTACSSGLVAIAQVNLALNTVNDNPVCHSCLLVHVCPFEVLFFETHNPYVSSQTVGKAKYICVQYSPVPRLVKTVIHRYSDAIKVPFLKRPWKFVLPGIIVFTVLWMLNCTGTQCADARSDEHCGGCSSKPAALATHTRHVRHCRWAGLILFMVEGVGVWG